MAAIWSKNRFPCLARTTPAPAPMLKEMGYLATHWRFVENLKYI